MVKLAHYIFSITALLSLVHSDSIQIYGSSTTCTGTAYFSYTGTEFTEPLPNEVQNSIEVKLGENTHYQLVYGAGSAYCFCKGGCIDVSKYPRFNYIIIGSSCTSCTSFWATFLPNYYCIKGTKRQKNKNIKKQNKKLKIKLEKYWNNNFF